MASDLLTLFVQALYLLSIGATVGGFILTIVGVFKEGGHFFKHHPTDDCTMC